LASKESEFGEKKRKIRAITPLKVIKGHRDTDWTSQRLLRGESVFLTGMLGLP